MSGQFPFFSWRQGILKSGLQPTTRHVLLTLACHMNDAGESCYPSIDLLMDETGLSRPSVINHLKLACDSGWIVVEKHGFAGKKWARNEYRIAWPGDDKAVKEVYHHEDEGGKTGDDKAVKEVYSSTSVNSPVVNSSLRSELTTQLVPTNSAPEKKPASGKVTVNEDGTFNIPRLLLNRWREAYPDVDIPAEVRKARAWLATEVAADGRKAKKNLGSFLRRWMARSQQDAEKKPRQKIKPSLEDLHDQACQSVSHVSGERCCQHGTTMRNGRWLCSDHAQDERYAWEEFHRRTA